MAGRFESIGCIVAAPTEPCLWAGLLTRFRIILGVELLRARGTDAVRKLCLGMLADVALDVAPVTLVVADLFACGADR